MVGGILIPNAEGVRWFEETYGRELRKDHRGEPLGVEYAPRRDAPWYDFLAATQLEKGVGEHDNPHGIDEVLQVLSGQQMKGDSAREEQMRGILCKLGRKPKNSSRSRVFAWLYWRSSTGDLDVDPTVRSVVTNIKSLQRQFELAQKRNQQLNEVVETTKLRPGTPGTSPR
ncbi:hypothetical protein DFH09DRAFT_1375968 [Mycena vulgaris]|nr:hypothetical protein DFH09DRAFT_1375968 [Mycena vulgaris]